MPETRKVFRSQVCTLGLVGHHARNTV